METADRYKILPGSISGHCCFTATVVDTTRPVMIGDKHYERDGVKHYEAVCECFEEEDAKLIATSLNARVVTLA